MKKSPCAKCQYLSDDKGACMFFIHRNIPFADEIDFGDGYPDECLALGELERTIDYHIDDHENAWAKLLEALEMRRGLQEELTERSN